MARDPKTPQDDGTRAAAGDVATAESGAPAARSPASHGVAPPAPPPRDGEEAAAAPADAAVAPGFVRRFRRGRWTVTEAPR
ncbi:hypothetical protein [Rubrivivax gelatinosus]|uniref:Uncharacterized protein n=1 Tax=Rubrivivax gelatinosus TaxID=28068 RepID=A0ABS1DSV8_RUBGE|nr:hypothetical protein [Rubrivivax gelatinosus]MBK1713076.1 hypothetical protein [Rubrivivax gelatinosus]